MGDAAFLLLAQEPATGLAVFGLGAMVDLVTGMMVNALHGDDFLRPRNGVSPASFVPTGGGREIDLIHKVSLALIIPGILLEVLAAAQIEPDITVFGVDMMTAFGVAGELVATVTWLFCR